MNKPFILSFPILSKLASHMELVTPSITDETLILF